MQSIGASTYFHQHGPPTIFTFIRGQYGPMIKHHYITPCDENVLIRRQSFSFSTAKSHCTRVKSHICSHLRRLRSPAEWWALLTRSKYRTAKTLPSKKQANLLTTEDDKKQTSLIWKLSSGSRAPAPLTCAVCWASVTRARPALFEMKNAGFLLMLVVEAECLIGSNDNTVEDSLCVFPLLNASVWFKEW